MLAGLATATLAGCNRSAALPPAAPEGLPFANGDRPLVAYPGKRPMLRLTARPPQLETPFAVFDEGALTPNDAFFVRYHLAGLPTEIDLDTYRLDVAGHVATPLSLSLDALKRDFAPVEIVAVNQCSGNSRGFVEPRVGGGQLGNGGMGNARWTGVPLRTVLDRAGVKGGAVEVAFDGLDGPVSPATPDFAKSLPLDHARDGEVMLAWAQNGADLPFLNGFPLRLVVPGYFGTYWVKHLNRITVLDRPLKSFWMDTAYRVPDNDCQCVAPGTKPDKTRPIGRFAVRSFVTSLVDGAQVPAGDTLVRGIAFDGGSGIAQVAVSADGGKAWQKARLGPDLGRFSFRQWDLPVRLAAGSHRLMVRATARSGEIQPLTPRWNPPGYLRNVVETLTVTAA